MKSIRNLLILFTLLAGAPGLHAEVSLNPDGPQHYTVKQGDTLWDIAGRFLQHPWQWPEVWKANPDIENPDLIYPGDELVLIQTADGPAIRLSRNSGPLKLKPEIRSSAIVQPIPTIPLYKISQFLDESLVLPDSEKDNHQTRVLQSTDEHVVTGAGDKLFVKNLTGTKGEKFGIYRLGAAYVDPDTGSVLGHEALYLAEAVTVESGDPGVAGITKSKREVLPGDLLIPRKDGIVTPTFKPAAPSASVNGKIIKVLDGVSLIGRDSVIVINRGLDAGLEVGNVLLVKQNLSPSQDTQNQGYSSLPLQTAGEVMLFRVFDQVSLGLIMTATLPIRVLDVVASP